MTRPYPAIIAKTAGRYEPRSIDAMVIEQTDTGAAYYTERGQFNAMGLREWCLGKTVYTPCLSAGLFQSILSDLDRKQLVELQRGGYLNDGTWQIYHRASQGAGYITFRRGRQAGTIINAYSLCGGDTDLQSINGCISQALERFKHSKLPCGDLRSPGSVAGQITEPLRKLSPLPRPDIARLFNNSYRGPRFESATFGSIPHVSDYDITAAYPSIMADMPSTLDVIWNTGKEIPDDAIYGTAIADITIDPSLKRGPLAVRFDDNALFYPVGRLKSTHVNLPELRTLRNLDPVYYKVHNAAYAVPVREPFYPYRKAVRKLFKLRESTTGPFRDFVKAVMVSLYGRTISTLPDRRGRLTAPPSWNPIYASHITSSLRVRCYEMGLNRDVVGEYADGVTFSDGGIDDSHKRLSGRPGIGDLRCEGDGPMFVLSDSLKQSEWKQGTWDLRGLCAAQRESTVLSVPVNLDVTIGLMESLGLPDESLGTSHQITYPIPIGPRLRTLPIDSWGLTCGDLLDGQYATNPPTYREAQALNDLNHTSTAEFAIMEAVK